VDNAGLAPQKSDAAETVVLSVAPALSMALAFMKDDVFGRLSEMFLIASIARVALSEREQTK
jgi:hypothetical protein